MARDRVYLDHAASSPMSEAALEAERTYEAQPYAGANPNSLHTMGRQAARALDGARATLARCLGCGFRPSDVTFTSGGTESNNLALWGLAEGARARDRKRVRVIMSSIEHDSVLDVAPSLRNRGFEVSFAPVGRDGRVSLDALGSMLGPDVALVSVMAANNETGIVQPLADVAKMAHAAGALVHTDAVQAFGRIRREIADVDAVSIAAHKIGGPVRAHRTCVAHVPLPRRPRTALTILTSARPSCRIARRSSARRCAQRARAFARRWTSPMGWGACRGLCRCW